MHLQCLHLEVVNEQTEQQAVICSWFLFTIIYLLPHTHTRNGPEHLTLGRPQEKFQLGEKLTVYSFRFFTRCGQIHYHSCTWAPTTRGKISVQKVAGSSAAKLRAWFGSSGMHHFKAENPSFSENFKVFHLRIYFAKCRLFILWKYNGGPHEICHFLKEYLPIFK